MTFLAILAIVTVIVLGVVFAVVTLTFFIMMLVDILDETRSIAARMIARRR